MFKTITNNVRIIVLTGVILALMSIPYLMVKDQYKGYVKVENTQSGMFIIMKGRIYTVSELQTEQSEKVNLSHR